MSASTFEGILSSPLFKRVAVGFGVVMIIFALSLIPAPAEAAPHALKLCQASGTIKLIGRYGVEHSWQHRVNLPASAYNKLFKTELGGLDVTQWAMVVPAGAATNSYIDFWVSSKLGNMIWPRTNVSTVVRYFC